MEALLQSWKRGISSRMWLPVDFVARLCPGLTEGLLDAYLKLGRTPHLSTATGTYKERGVVWVTDRNDRYVTHIYILDRMRHEEEPSHSLKLQQYAEDCYTGAYHDGERSDFHMVRTRAYAPAHYVPACPACSPCTHVNSPSNRHFSYQGMFTDCESNLDQRDDSSYSLAEVVFRIAGGQTAGTERVLEGMVEQLEEFGLPPYLKPNSNDSMDEEESEEEQGSERGAELGGGEPVTPRVNLMRHLRSSIASADAMADSDDELEEEENTERSNLIATVAEFEVVPLLPTAATATATATTSATAAIVTA